MTTQKTKQEIIIRLAGKGFLGIIGVLVFGFVGMKIYPIIHGPALDLTNLRDGGIVTEPLVSISGIAKYTHNLIINGNELPLSPNGSFNDKIILNPGYNLISIAAHDQFGTITRHDYSLILKESSDTPKVTVRY